MTLALILAGVLAASAGQSSKATSTDPQNTTTQSTEDENTDTQGTATQGTDTQSTATHAATSVQQQLTNTQQALVKAQAQTAVATAEAKVAKAEATTAKDAIAELKSGKLLSLGLTGGAAVALQTPSPIRNENSQHVGVGTTSVAYLLLLPAYWGASDANRNYCASSWTTGDEDAAIAASIATTKRQAEREIKAAIAEIRTQMPKEMILATVFPHNPRAEVLLPRIAELATLTPDEYERQSPDVINALAQTIWDPTRSSSCFWKKFGVWLGKPSSYNVKTSYITDTTSTTREFTPQVAFGVGFAPNAYFSVLVGFTLGTFRLATSDSGQNESEITWASTIAVGGNLDLVSALFK